jgi:hypothetical protein
VLTAGGADIISVTCTAAFGVPTVARLSRDDFTQIAAQRVSISIDIGLGLLGRAGLDDRFHETCVMELTNGLVADSSFAIWRNEERDHGRMAAGNRIDDNRRRN